MDSYWGQYQGNKSKPWHANIGITLDTYGHLLPSMAKTAAEQFDNLLKPWLNEENVGR
jgi:GH24 family phage-related lysozyme (muramidase)